MKELEKVKTRGLTTFYLMIEIIKIYKNMAEGNITRTMSFGGKVTEYGEEKSIIEIKNKLQIGDKLEIIVPGKLEPVEFTIDQLWNEETDEPISEISRV